MLIIAIKEENHSEENRKHWGHTKKQKPHHKYEMNPIKQYK